MTMTKFYGTNDGDFILGWGSDDKIYGYGGNDVLLGMDGTDVLIGGAGADFLDGGSGIDTASYYGSPAGVTVNLKTGQGSGGDAEGDTLMNIEWLVGSEYNDVLVGDDGFNYLAGGGGNDTLLGGEAIDDLYGGEGTDTLKGGGGSDHLFGGDDGDYLYGENGSDDLNGGDGNDHLSGGDGSDSLSGGKGGDYLSGGDGSDDLSGGSGTDILIGGAGGDTFHFDAWNVVIDKNGAIEHQADSPKSDPDHIVDFLPLKDEFDVLSFDEIDMPTAGTATNYIETEIGYNAGYLEALKWADGQIGEHWMFGFVTDRVNGYLFGDLNSDGILETGIVLEGLTSLDDFNHSFIN
jgi:Ca2+-binding RTX toxin-like protein